MTFQNFGSTTLSNQVAKAQELKLGQNLSNHLSNTKGLNQSP